MGAVTTVADPIVACAGELRRLPGPRSAAVLSAWTYQPGEPPESPVGPLDEVVDVVAAAQRLAGWAVWCQLAAAARLLLAWSKRSPLGSEAHKGCDEIDRALAQRLDRIAEREQRHVRRRLDPEELAPDFVSMELALACGLTRSAATHRVLVAQSLIVDRRHPRDGRTGPGRSGGMGEASSPGHAAGRTRASRRRTRRAARDPGRRPRDRGRRRQPAEEPASPRR
jgi:hypothetical protein